MVSYVQPAAPRRVHRGDLCAASTSLSYSTEWVSSASLNYAEYFVRMGCARQHSGKEVSVEGMGDIPGMQQVGERRGRFQQSARLVHVRGEKWEGRKVGVKGQTCCSSSL